MSRKTHGTSRPSFPPSRPASPAGGSGEESHNPAAYAFLVRLWKETRELSGQRPLWRGTLSNLQGHNLGSFGTMVELGELLARATGANAELLLRDRDDEH